MKLYIAIADKLKEADFFLEKMKGANRQLDELNYYFSAFVSAARSVTFVMQYVASELDGFEEWYGAVQAELRQNKLAKFMLEARNEHQKKGVQPISRGEVVTLADGSEQLLHFFDYLGIEPPAEVPRLDALTVCAIHMGTTTNLVDRFFRQFESQIHRPDEDVTRSLSWMGVVTDNLVSQGYPRELFDQAALVSAVEAHAAITPLEKIADLIDKHPKPVN